MPDFVAVMSMPGRPDHLPEVGRIAVFAVLLALLSIRLGQVADGCLARLARACRSC